MHDEGLRSKQRQSWKPRFWAGPTEQFSEAGQKEIKKRIDSLFAEVKTQYSNIFRGNEEITLSNRALAFIVSELAKYDLTRTDVDAKGVAYQELVGVNLRGDRGQYFTPRGVVKLAIEMLDPQENERLLDPACGTGGFLVAALGNMLEKFRQEQNTLAGAEDTQDFLNVHERLREYAASMVYGADFDPFLIRAAQMNMVLAGDGRGHIYHLNSLEFPQGHMTDLSAAKKEINFETVDIIATNPPFGSDIPITDRHILEQYELAHVWESDGEGGFRKTRQLKSSVSPEILFIERCVKWLKPGTGRMGIVLPNGILGNPAMEYIRWWIMKETQVLASVDLPVEAFIVEANVNILTSLLFLRRKSEQEKNAEALGGTKEYRVFMAVVDKVGFDRRGNKLYQRTPNGEEIVKPVEKTESIRIGGEIVKRVLIRNEKIEDNDLPIVAEKYREFRKEYE
jgi:type I restriction enzyme M protein